MSFSLRPMTRSAAVLLLGLLFFVAGLRADTIDLMNGAKVQGKILENNEAAKTITVEFTLGGSLVKRTVPYNTVHAITVDGARTVLTPKPGGATTSGAANAPLIRTTGEVRALIARVGPTEPDWLKTAKLNYPKTLDLSWKPSPGKWDNQKNVGQFIWDIINPNENRWQEGIKFVYYLLDQGKADAELRQKATTEIGSMYFRFFEDYERAAWWWEKAGVEPGADHNGVGLIECYWRLGSKQLAMDKINDLQFIHLGNIKLLGDMLETDRSVKMAEDYIRGGGPPHDAWLMAGDALRLAGRFDEAKSYYEKVVSTPPPAQQPGRVKRTIDRSKENLAALDLYRQADVAKVKDGTYEDSSLGYEGQVEVSVKVRNHRIESVKVTKHKEKQYYSSLTDMPEQIIAKQGVKGVDATSRATITGEAIINATAKALAKGSPAP